MVGWTSEVMTGHRTQNTLTALAVAKQKRPGLYGDGAGLSLVVTAAGVKRWELRLSASGHRRQLGLGLYPAVSLDDARRTRRRCAKTFAGTHGVSESIQCAIPSGHR